MAKAKKPASTGGSATDKSAGGKTTDSTPQSARSMPKTQRAKTTAASTGTAKTSVSEKKAIEDSTPPAKPAVSEATKPADPKDNATSKPVDVKPAETPEANASKPSEPAKPVVKPAVAAPASQPPKKPGSIFWPLVFGGALAAALGFLAAEMNVLGTRIDDSDMRARLNDQQAQIAALESAEQQVPEIEMPDLGPLRTEVATVSESLAALESRLTDVEKRPISEGGSSAAAVAAYERELEALQASVQQQRSEIEGLLENALSVEEATTEAARKTTLQAALTRITAAISTGQPFAEPLSVLETNGMGDVPAALADTADTGVVTMGNLQSRFPDTARSVLSVARANGTDADTGGFGGFLKRQLGARSVAPRDGTDPDAILSRAEAAVRDGRLSDALNELEMLPEISQSDLDAWVADARARFAAETAAEDLSQRLTAN